MAVGEDKEKDKDKDKDYATDEDTDGFLQINSLSHSRDGASERMIFLI